MGWVVVALGIFSICGAAFDWDWFMNSRKARLWVSAFGRGGARVVYGLLGGFLVVIGVLVALGVVGNSS